MDTRRDFIKKAALLSGMAGLSGVLPASIQKALAIDPAPGSTYLDAEHIVILMQENRSFDHSYGTLRGVRGFNDPRAITLPNGNPVWLQSNKAGETYPPFRLNIKETKSTWMGSLPHSWSNQVDARNGGRHDGWIEAKPSGHKDYAGMPLTMGHYTRQDIPFYYSLADAFTICDQHFCSSLTGTTPNRLYLWTGTVRGEAKTGTPANVRNEDTDYGRWASWTTFPERLEDAGISWRIYQNELSIDSGFQGEEDAWLSNFTDNPIEWFTQYHVEFAEGRRAFLERAGKTLPAEIEALKKQAAEAAPDSRRQHELNRRIQEKTEFLKRLPAEREKWSRENFEALPAREKNLHAKAFTTNRDDPDYRSLTTLEYKDGDETRKLEVPKGDTLHQFRQDVKNGKLPTVSWLVAPENFSDHPGAAWYGAWYVSEVLDILTKNPAVWRKTIFILTYDENDGYFDHVPPFVAPQPGNSASGKVSLGIDPGVEYVELADDLKRKPAGEARGSSIGLGYRVPFVVASPWSRGGRVCSQVFDHTSVLQLLEKILTRKTGKEIKETNISAWRRAVCGDLTSVFKPWNGEKIPLPEFLPKDEFIEGIHNAKSKDLPKDFHQLTTEEIAAIKRDPAASPLLTRQEEGTKPSCPLPYELYAHGRLSADRSRLEVTFAAGNQVFGAASAGSPFNVHVPVKYRTTHSLLASQENTTPGAFRSYAVLAGDRVTDSWALADFEDGAYHIQAHGPNGFLREFIGSANDPQLTVLCEYERGGEQGVVTGNPLLRLVNKESSRDLVVEIRDLAYGGLPIVRKVRANSEVTVPVPALRSHGWYDFSVTVNDAGIFEQRFAGRVETGRDSISDPVMGRVRV
ncbi:MAG TPA: phospholipase C, phosphocholine-specific [Verrucomicrobiae bacterium]|nr:phospholipase C, phosphocholine-specific [Verrucomicrobiae bacterium]